MLREGDQLLLGPSQDGTFHPVTVTSVKRNRASCRVVHAGQAATVAISGMDRNLLRRVSLIIELLGFLQEPGICRARKFPLVVWDK